MYEGNPPGPLRASDEVVLDDLRELLGQDGRLRGLSLFLRVRGGVAHVEGCVPDRETRDAVRRRLALVKGVNAVWDVMVLPDQETLTIVDLGCGDSKQIPWALGVDRHPFPGIDVVSDMEHGLPFGDQQVDHIYAVHFLEHVHALVPLMNEIHRVLKPDGLLHVITPHVGSHNAVADPTHVRYFNAGTFRYFCEDYPWIRRYRPLCVAHDGGDLLVDLLPVKAGASSAPARELSHYFGG